ncbi:MAG: hypothetical protein HY537_00300 [Deltaproteobacteria bacterium]|nr:hypothetical protein [Deltaproteobacteria bacterium]
MIVQRNRLSFFFMVVSLFLVPAHADITIRTESHAPYLKMESFLKADPTEAWIDAAQLGLALSSLISGESLLISAALDPFKGGLLSAPVNRVYGGWTAINETAQLLQALDDKATHEEDALFLSKDGRLDRVIIAFYAHSDDDKFGHLKVDAYSDPNIFVRSAGQGTTQGSVTVEMRPRNMNPGVYPLVFFAKETDCNICLSVVHTVFVTVYDPCPLLGFVCQQDIGAYHRAGDTYKRQYGATQAIIQRGNQAILQLKARDNACYHAHGRTATGGGSSEEARLRAAAAYSNCLDQVELMKEQMKGQCPELAYNASAAECSRLRNRERVLAPYLRAIDNTVATLKSHNCCQEFVNPNGGSGPLSRPPIIGPRPN